MDAIFPNDHAVRMDRAVIALRGLSIGDAFGERFFGPAEIAIARIDARTIPSAPWRYTDDTVMALSIVETLREHGRIDRSRLAQRFANRWAEDPARGYGGGAHALLQQLALGRDWRETSRELFGTGSFGNGGAMRAAPIGAYFANDDDAVVVREAIASAEVTHAHAEGRAGAVAIALAAAHVSRLGLGARSTLIRFVHQSMEPGETRAAIAVASEIDHDEPISRVAERLGTGQRVSAMDTVPFALWCAARHLDSFESAMWTTVRGLGDRDTTCAIVGGIVALAAPSSIPDAWLTAREPLPAGFEIG